MSQAEQRLGLIERAGYEEIWVWEDESADLQAIASLHSTARGPAVGGTRWQPYGSRDDALRDVLRLSQAMTKKAACAQLPFGGGKAVVIGDPEAKTEAQLRSYGAFLNHLNGRFLTTTDVGTTTAELDQLSQWTPHLVGLSAGSGDTSALTATTVLQGMRATLEALDGDGDFGGRRMVVVGVGKVGSKVARALAAEGAEVTVADIRAVGAAALAQEIGARTASVDDAMTLACDLLSPNALGGVLNERSIPQLRCRAICGAANNQLEREPEDADLIAQRGILYAPDYLVNSGGLISVAIDIAGWDAARSQAQADAVIETARVIFARARERGETPLAAAEARVREILAASDPAAVPSAAS